LLLLVIDSVEHAAGPAGSADPGHDTEALNPSSSQSNSTSDGTVMPEEMTDSMSINTVEARAAAAAALVRQHAPEPRFLPIAARPVPDHPGYFQVNRIDRTGRPLSSGAGSTSPPCDALRVPNCRPDNGSEVQ
jgi:hypothetical protein